MFHIDIRCPVFNFDQISVQSLLNLSQLRQLSPSNFFTSFKTTLSMLNRLGQLLDIFNLLLRVLLDSKTVKTRIHQSLTFLNLRLVRSSSL